MELSHLQRAVAVQRRHVLGALEGLSDEALVQPVSLPSGWTPLGLVHHLAVDVERWWFQGAMTRRVRLDAFEGDAWSVPADLAPGAVLDLYRQEAAMTDAVIAATDLDAVPVQWPEAFGPLPFPNLRALVLHLIGETATHAGHLDAARELLDGGQWLVLD